MSGGYMRVDPRAWNKARAKSRWTRTNRAPDWWVAFDVAWHIDQREIPSAREAGEFWGWDRTSAGEALREGLEAAIGWTKDEERRGELEALRPKPRGRHAAVETLTSGCRNPDTGCASDADRSDSVGSNNGVPADDRARLPQPASGAASGGTQREGAPAARDAGSPARPAPAGELRVLSQPWGETHQAVWEAWRSWPAGAALPEACPDSQRVHIRRAVAAHPVAELVEVFRWLNEADEPGTTAFRARPDLQTLVTVLHEDRLAGRVLGAAAWAKRGRPKGRDALVRQAVVRRGTVTRSPAERMEQARTRGKESGAWMAQMLLEGKLEFHESDHDSTPEDIRRGHGLATIEEAEVWLVAYRAEVGPALAELAGGAHAEA